jgi:hypothetical protein
MKSTVSQWVRGEIREKADCQKTVDFDPSGEAQRGLIIRCRSLSGAEKRTISAANVAFSTQKRTGLDNAKRGARRIRVAISKSLNMQCVGMRNCLTLRKVFFLT